MSERESQNLSLCPVTHYGMTAAGQYGRLIDQCLEYVLMFVTMYLFEEKTICSCRYYT